MLKIESDIGPDGSINSHKVEMNGIPGKLIVEAVYLVGNVYETLTHIDPGAAAFLQSIIRDMADDPDDEVWHPSNNTISICIPGKDHLNES